MALLGRFIALGYSLNESLELLIEYDSKSNFQLLQTQLSRGATMIEALKVYQIAPRWFTYFCLIYPHGGLADAITKANKMYQKEQEMLNMLKSKLSYPFLLIILMILFAVFSMVAILPQFSKMLVGFSNPDGIFPISFAFHLLGSFPFILLLGVSMVMVCLLYIYQRVKYCHYAALKCILKWPFFGALLQYYYSIKFASVLASLVSYMGGINDIVDFLYQSLNQDDLMVVVYSIKKNIEKGTGIADWISHSSFFHPSFRQFFLLIDKTQRPLTQLNDYVNTTTEQLEVKLKHYQQLLTAIIYASTAIFIIGMYLLFLLPMISMIEQL